MQRLTAEETLAYVIRWFTDTVNQLQLADRTNKNPFIHGEKTAYVEGLEMIQQWQNAEQYGLNYDVEKRFPI